MDLRGQIVTQKLGDGIGDKFQYGLRDTGRREVSETGFVREPEDEEKLDMLWLLKNANLNLLPREMVERFLDHMALGAVKYAPNNWRKARGPEAVERFQRSAIRHMIQWLAGDTAEDHVAAITFNIWAAEIIGEDTE